MGTKGEKTKEMICRCTKPLFASNGFGKVTMQDVCNATGLSRGGLYRHYACTGDILLDILGTSDNVQENISRGETPTEILNSYLEQYYNDMLDKEGSLSLAIYEFANQGHNAIFADGTKTARSRWIKLVEYGIRTGEFIKVDPEEIADIMLFAYQGVRMWSKIIPMDESVAQHVVNVVRTLLLPRIQE